MSPAYLIFLLNLNETFNYATDITFSNQEMSINLIHCFIALFIFLSIIFTVLLKKLLLNHYDMGKGVPVLSNDLYKYKNIKEKNGSIISFLVGNIIPSVIIFENSIFLSILFFIFLQVLIFLLSTKSTGIFPNAALILLNVDICKTETGDYLFVLGTSESEQINRVYQLGFPKESKVFITKKER